VGTSEDCDQFVKCNRIQRELADSMPLLALPGTAILVSRIVGLDFLKANRADEDPLLGFVDTNSIENIIRLLTTLT